MKITSFNLTVEQLHEIKEGDNIPVGKIEIQSALQAAFDLGIPVIINEANSSKKYRVLPPKDDENYKLKLIG